MAVVWSEEEVDLIVEDYLDMLSAELSGQEYSKAEHRRALLPKLDERTEASIEFKHQNISAVLREEGKGWIRGYRPAKNFQRALREPLLRRLTERGIALPDGESESNSIPDGIGRVHILEALGDLTEGREHGFGESTKYDVLYEGERFPPKAVVGLAAARLIGKPLRP